LSKKWSSLILFSLIVLLAGWLTVPVGTYSYPKILNMTTPNKSSSSQELTANENCRSACYISH